WTGAECVCGAVVSVTQRETRLLFFLNGNRYVLTSPRSLEACARLGVKPVDLLFRSLTDFIDENQKSSLEEVTALYEEYEKGRRERLRLCREDREQIIQEGWNESHLQSTDSKAQCPSETRFTNDRSKSAISISDGFPSACGQKFPYSFSLADLRRSPAMERRLKKSLSQEISRKLSIAVPEKDRKIAALMLAKHEEEQFSLRQSMFEEHRRKDREEERRAHMERKRRKELLQHIRQARVQEMRSRAAKEEEQMRMAQQRARRENRDRMEQKQMWVQRCQLQTERAVMQAQEQRRRRAQGVRRENQEKLSHHRLRERVLEEEKAQWEERCKAVTQKEQCREKLQKERAEAQERSRKVAHASCYMRERVREQTSRRTFDRMAREAELNWATWNYE
uniref:Coiled-coil domain containing 177 n=1 Tax=Sinocyclocheilus rhinocerous TaxID=307959 RepID=A0A673IUW5_9TELE